MERVECPKEKLGWNYLSLRRVIVRDEISNLDGLGGLNFYWHDLGQELKIFFRYH